MKERNTVYGNPQISNSLHRGYETMNGLVTMKKWGELQIYTVSLAKSAKHLKK